MIPSGTRFIGIAPTVNLTERKSASINAETQPYTIDDIRGYKVYTALLTQIGGNEESDKNPGDDIFKGVTYYINDNPDNSDFTIYGAPNNNVGTYFVCNQDGVVPSGAQLLYNGGAPVVTVLENTIGNIWFTYNGVGSYSAYSNSLFTIGKTFSSIYSQPIDTVGDGVQFALIQYKFPDINNIVIQTGRLEVENGDDYLSNTPIEIRIYN